MHPLSSRAREPLASAGLLVIRLFTGLGIAAHGWDKVFGAYGVGGFAGFLGKAGVPLPGLSAWLSVGAELLGGLLVAAGFLTRPAAALLAFNMLVAAALGHWGAYFLPAGMEYALNLAAVYAGLALLGAGRFSVDAKVFAPKGE